MKKLLCILVAMIMFAFLLSSCDKGNETPGTDDPNVHTHSFGDWLIEKQATCGEAGLFSRTCNTCGEIESQNIAPTGIHRQVEDASVAATCTSTGLTSGVHCGDCGLVIIPQNEIPVTDHVFSSENDGTCNKCGFYRDIICAHDALITISDVAPTCTTSGLTEGKKCNNCGDMITAQSEIPALGHTEVVEAAKPATCTEPGHTVKKTCSTCNEVVLQSSVIYPVGHRSTEWIIEIEPTESTEGLKYKICTVCTTRFDDTTIPFVGANGIAYEPNAIGNTCTVTGIGTFSGEELYIPDYISGYRVTAIADKAFQNCIKLTKLVIPETVKTIGNYAFSGCTGLTEFIIPASVTYIGGGIFDGNTKMTTVYYNSTYSASSYYDSTYYHGILNNTYITKVVFNGSFVPVGVVNNCDYIEQIEFGNNVTAIKEGALYDCGGIKEIVIPGSVVSVGKNAFWCCGNLSNIVLSCGLETIGRGAFMGLPIESIEIPYGVTFIDSEAFYGCDLKSVILPETLTSVGSDVFKYCYSLTEVNIPSSLTTIGDGMFGYCGLTSIVIPETVASIGAWAFQDCPLVNVIISEGVTSIGGYAFYDCKKLTGIVIPKSVTEIGGDAFRDCISLTDVYYTGTQTEWSAINFDSYNNEYLISAEKYYNYVLKV